MSDNPHLERLSRQPRSFTNDITAGFVMMWLVINLLIVTYGVLQLRGTLSMFIAAGGVMAGYSLIIGPFLAWFTAQDASRVHYDLLRLTMLTRRDLVWGYIWGGLRRFHHATGIPAYAIPPMILVTDIIILLAASTRFRFTGLDIPFEMELYAFVSVMSLTCISLLSIASSVALGLWLRNEMSSFGASLVLQAVVLSIWYLVVVQIDAKPTLMTAATVTGLPLLLTGLSLRLAYRLAD